MATRDELDAWVRDTVPWALAYARSLLHDPTRAEDVVQDCFCRLLAKRDAYDLPRDGRRLLFKAVTNAAINVTTRERRALSLDALAHADDGRGWEPTDPAAFSPEQLTMHKELQAAVADGLARLPALHRAALELKVLGHTPQEIAEALELTAGHVRVLVHRARQTLAEYLAPFVGGATA
jgi:RNA polymerase sigma-70 factor (ECF subfamily)